MGDHERRRVRARANRRGRMPSRAIVYDAEYAALLEGDPLGLGDGPLFPEAIGAILGELLQPTPPAEQDGPPWTHTFRPPEPEYDEEGNELPPKIEPMFTITKVRR